MIKSFFVIVCVVFTISAQACDVCGCNPNGIGVNLVDSYTKNYLGIGFGSVKFTNEDMLRSDIEDYFSSVNITGRFHINSWLKFQGSLPYAFNIRKQKNEDKSLQGLGDAKIEAYVTVLDKMTVSGLFYIEVGSGLLMPTGKYDANLLDKDMPINFNPGRGTWGHSFNINSSMQKDAYSLELNGAYNFYYAKDGYKHGSQALIYTSLSRTMNIDDHRIIPSVKLAYEHMNSDVYATGVKAHGTGGNTLSGAVGLSYAVGRVLLTGNYFMPLHSSFSDGEAVNNYKVQTQVTYLF